jgi:hypothetical protein
MLEAPAIQDPDLTVVEAMTILSPPIRRRTLERLLRRYAVPVGIRRPTNGRPARTYRTSVLYCLHAAWVRGTLDGLPDQVT